MVYFYSYSFLGFLLETAYAFLVQGCFAWRKCYLFSWLCPVYGLGALAIITASRKWKKKKLATFLIGMLVASLTEYCMDIYYRDLLGTPFWDYHDMPYNVNGRICLLFTFFWGLLSLALVYWIHPRLEHICKAVPHSVVTLGSAFFLADAILSTFLLGSLQTRDALDLIWLAERLS